MRRPGICVILIILLAVTFPLITGGSRLDAAARGRQLGLDDDGGQLGATFVPGQLIIRFKPGVTKEQIADFYVERGLAEKENLDRNPDDKDKPVKLATARVNVSQDLIKQLENDPRVAYAEPNYVFHVDKSPDDSSFDKLWGLHNTGQTGGTAGADVGAVGAWDISTGSTDVIVGIIDTGVDYKHEDLAKNMWTNPGECPQSKCEANGKDDDNNGYVDDFYGINAITDSGDPMDDFGHGTHVAGTIGAVGNNGIGVVGVNWTVRIAACKFLDDSGSGTVAAAVKCFNYFHDLKNKQKQNLLVTSNSWGSPFFSEALRDAMAGADQPLHICAAGNSDSGEPHYPAGYDLDNIISVAATDHNDQYASFTNYGVDWVDLAAPGVDILSTVPKGSCPLCDPTGYTTLSGTSMATPHVTGAVALIWSQYSKLTNSQVKQRLLSGVDPLQDRSKQTLTNGRLNLLNALENDTVPPATVTDLTVSGALLTSMKLTWTATGDDGLKGKANAYDVRYSTSPISDANWDQATQAEGEPAPQQPGSRETFTVAGLEPGKTYYFALRVLDNVGNLSDMSNVVVGKTSVGTIAFADDMEGGPGKWTTEGKDNLWHLSALRSNSPTTAWYYGKEDTRNYDTGGANNGTITSQPIELVGADDVLLTFSEWSELQLSTRFDRTRVQVSTDGKAWTTVFESHGTENAWVKHSVSLTPYITTTGVIQVRFWFDTIDDSLNNFEGWYVDDVQVLTAKLERPGAQRLTPNLVMQESNILFNPANPTAGDALTIHATVLNNGTGEANDVLVQFMDVTANGSTPIGQPQTIPNLPIGDSGTAQVVYDTGGKTGERSIQVVVDPNNFVSELNEADNTATRKVTITPAPAANLLVKASNIGFEPPAPDPGAQVTIRATIFNTGTVEAREVTVQFADVTGFGSLPIDPPQTIDVIPPGGSRVVQITLDTTGLPGDRDIEVAADVNNAIPETNESDNKAEKTLKFAPQFAPNLNMDSSNIGFAPANPTAGDRVTIYATILNDGSAAAHGVTVQFIDATNTSSAPIGQQQTIDVIPAGGSATVQMAYDTTDKVGDRKLQVVVDPNNFVPEIKESDNSAQKTLKVTAASAPNLVANASNINFSSATPTEGDQVTIYATILNNGTDAARDVLVQFVDATNGGSIPIGDKQTISVIPAGGSGLAQVTYATKDKVGDRQIQVIVDPNNLIPEIDETDNMARDSLRVMPPPAPNLVMLASNIEFNPPEPTDHDQVTIHAVILNNGVTEARNVLVQFIDLTNGNAVPITKEQFINVIPAGGSGEAQATYDVATLMAGLVKDRKIQVVVDSNNLIPEMSETDNAATKILPVVASPAPNLVMLADNIGFNPAEPTAGEPVTISARILNNGTAEARNVVVQVVDITTGRPLPIGEEQTIAVIPVGGSGVVQVTYDTTDKAGDHLIRVVVDPNNRIAETDETDNKNTATLTVVLPSAPNLVVQAGNIGFNPPRPTEGAPVTVTATILNNGIITASNVLVQFVDVTDGKFVPIGAKQTIDVIPAGGSRTAQVIYDTTGQAGERKIYVVVDPHTVIRETNEADNSATQTLVVASSPAPNLVVQESNIGFGVAPTPDAGDVVTISATILNNGIVAANDVTVQFVDITNNGATPIGASQKIPVIPAGGSGVVQVAYDIKDKAGERKLQVFVDRSNLIPESNETDNTAKKTLKVALASTPNLVMQSSNIGFDPLNPNPGDQVTVYATIINDGDANAKAVQVQFVDVTDSGSAVPIGQPQTIETIPAGGSGTAQITYDTVSKTAGALGTRKLQVVVDPNNFILEAKESDNSAQKTLTPVTLASPNLTIQASNIGFAPASPTVGEAVNIVATIFNDGNANANDVVVQFFDVTTSGSTVPIGQPQTIDAIPVGGSGVAQIIYDTASAPGARKIQVVVDPNNFIQETQETDNNATTTLTVMPLPMPNLMMQASNIGFNPPNPVEGAADPGSDVIVNAVVLNNGGADANDVTVQFIDVTNGAAIPIGAPQTLPAIAAGSSGTAQIAYNTVGNTGERKLQVVVDPNNFIAESDESDNRAVATLNVAPPLAPNLKVLPSNIKFDPPTPEQGNLVTITVIILNNGTTDANDVVVQFTDVTNSGSLPIGTEQTIDQIPAGGSSTLSIKYDNTNEAGERAIQVTVDPHNIIVESDETDNRAMKTLPISAPIIPNLVVQPGNITFAPAMPIEGDPVTVTVTVLNQGTGDTSNVVVNFVDVTDGGSDLIGEPQTINTIPAHGSGTAHIIYNTTGKVGERRIQVIADPDNAIHETDETDNTANKTLKVASQAEKPTPLPNLVVQAGSIQFDPITPTVGSPVTVTITVTNAGSADASNVVVQLADVTGGGSEVIGKPQITGTLAAGKSGKTQVHYDTTGKTGKRDLQVTADPDNTIPESDETDNQATKTLNVIVSAATSSTTGTVALPNLVVQANEIALVYKGHLLAPEPVRIDSTSNSEGAPIVVAVTIFNTGNTDASNITVHFAAIMDEGQDVARPGRVEKKQIIDYIPRGGRITTQVTYDVATLMTGKAGYCDIQVAVDPNNTIPEVDETDNKASKLLSIDAVQASGYSP